MLHQLTPHQPNVPQTISLLQGFHQLEHVTHDLKLPQSIFHHLMPRHLTSIHLMSRDLPNHDKPRSPIAHRHWLNHPMPHQFMFRRSLPLPLIALLFKIHQLTRLHLSILIFLFLLFNLISSSFL
jgi:hypothetical protein